MKIVLLGHEDAASVYAHDLLISELPGHDFAACWSPPPPASEAEHPAMRELAAFDRQIFDDFLARPTTSAALKSASCLAAPNAADGLQQLREQAPDLIVSIRYRRILKDEPIAIPRLGVLNLHSGILPDYRGVMATFWAMLHKEAEIGATLHWIVDAGIDTGPVIGIARRPADYERSYLWNVLGLYEDGCRMTAQIVRKLARGEAVSGDLQSSSEGSYFSAPTGPEVTDFLGKGMNLADPGDLGSFSR